MLLLANSTYQETVLVVQKRVLMQQQRFFVLFYYITNLSYFTDEFLGLASIDCHNASRIVWRLDLGSKRCLTIRLGWVEVAAPRRQGEGSVRSYT